MEWIVEPISLTVGLGYVIKVFMLHIKFKGMVINYIHAQMSILHIALLRFDVGLKG